jgi:deazaflavin-dependent oxidoreductase (nitroreductase family)
MTVVQRVVSLLFANRVGTAIARRTLPVLDRIVFRLSGGRRTFIELVEPSFMLETIGAQSGLPRHNPLLYVRDGDRFVVAGTNFGQERHPAWSANLLAHPDAVVVLRGARIPVRAEPLTDPGERARLWPQLDRIYSGFKRYREVTADIREVRMFALVPR